MTARLPLIACLLLLLTGIQGQGELDLSAGLDPDPTVAPTPKKELNPTVKPDAPKPATSAPKADSFPDDVGFDLGDALGGNDENDPAATKKPQPGHGGGHGGSSFGDSDLVDSHDLPPKDPSGGDGHRGDEQGGQEQGAGTEKQSMIAGVVSALGVAAVGAISSFIAYQKKKLCFKGQAEDPENVNMDNQKGDQNDPQVQTNLLEK